MTMENILNNKLKILNQIKNFYSALSRCDQKGFTKISYKIKYNIEWRKSKK